MKLTKHYLFGAFATLMLGACSNDTIVQDVSRPGTITDNGEGVYMTVNIKMPTSGSSRSYTDGDNTSNSGVEEGQNFENSVNTVYVVIAKKSDNSFITYGEIPARNISMDNPSNPVLYKTTAKFSKNDIENYYEGLANNETDRDVNIFVFCNPTTGIREVLDEAKLPDGDKTNWMNAIGTVDTSEAATEIIWSENNFLMSNSAIATRTFPETIDDWNAFTTEDTPFNLSGISGGIDNSAENERGAVKVERAAARFDFKDGSPKFGGDSNTYPVVHAITTDADGMEVDGDCYIAIKLNKMSLVNMNKQFYYLRRVTMPSQNNNPANTVLCGAELPWFSNATGTLLTEKGNYVVSPNYDQMMDVIETNFSTYYNYTLFNNQGEIDNITLENWYTSVIDDVLGGTTDNYGDKEYKIWRYLTENSIPDTDVQKNGQTTGIVFKGKMIATEEALNSTDKNVAELAKIINNVDNVLEGDPNKDPILYKFTGAKNNSGGMYATWPNVEEAAKQAAIVPVWEASNDPQYQPAGGYWTLEINRSNSLFRAAFGSGTCGSYTFKTSSGEEVTVDDPVQTVDENSPSYLWHEWDKAGKPASNSTDAAMAELNKKMKAAMTESGFTLYQTSDDGTDSKGYYCYYYYWNRHNDNGRNGIMGPMEFCVVRNNVYKISVNKISSIGHPRITANDPTPPTPDTDDEIDDVYLTVQVEVLPWVVRVNDVEF